jgi:hypothetical protein
MIKEKYYETPYFIVEMHGRETKPYSKKNDLFWKGRVRVIRKDTMEIAESVALNFKDSKDSFLEEATLEAAKIDTEKLEKEPSDWKDPVRIILAEYERYREDTCRFFRIDKDAEFTAEQHSTILREAINSERQWSFRIVQMIHGLTEEQLSRLVQSSDNEYEGYFLAEDSRGLDRVRNKVLLFEYILNPSTELISLHEQHCKRIGLNRTDETEGRLSDKD